MNFAVEGDVVFQRSCYHNAGHQYLLHADARRGKITSWFVLVLS